MPTEKVQSFLEKMRSALVEPYWVNVELRDTFEQVSEADAAVRAFAVVADNGTGTLVAFDPVEDEFALIEVRSQALASIGVRGDAVGCWLAI